MSFSGALVPYLLGNPSVNAVSITNNTLTTSVTNSGTGGTPTTTTTTSVNIVPNTYLTSYSTTNLVNGVFTNVFSYGTLQPGVYITNFSYNVSVTSGTSVDYVDTRLNNTSLSFPPTTREQMIFTGVGIGGVYGSATFQFKLTSAATITLQANYVSASGVAQYNINPYITIQKIG